MRLGDVCSKIGSGATPRGGKDVYLEKGPFSLIRSQNVYNEGFHYEGLAFISEEHAKQLSNVEVCPNDVLLNITGDSVARVCQAPSGALPARVNQHVSIIRPMPNVLDSRFLRYFLASPPQQGQLLSLASAGATRPALTKGMIEDLVVPNLPVEEQKTIASVLGALDNKIELNRRMNETLEEMAQTIFKSWFVDFYPVKAKMAGKKPAHMGPKTAALFPGRFDDENGLPEGWEEKRIGDILELFYGKALRAQDRKPGNIPVYGSGGVVGFHDQALVDGPSVIVGRKGTVGSLYWEDSAFWPIDTVFYVVPKVELTFCYYLLQTLGLNDMNTDAAVPGLNRNNAYRLTFPCIPANLRKAFDITVLTLRQKIFTNAKESQILAELRDTLLPKLMSGEIRVKDVEKEVEKVL